MTLRSLSIRLACMLALAAIAVAQSMNPQIFDVKAHYTKQEHSIAMRDGVKLFTSIYAPRDTSKPYPIMLNRTPYGVGPYGADAYRTSVGPSNEMAADGYIFVYQDVRGKFMSEGTFAMMRPFIEDKKTPQDVDENSDTFDTIEWLLKNVPNDNGRVGMWGISYPGFYTSMGVIDSHPALKAASPQAPIADMFTGDDFHHHGAFFLAHAFRFLATNTRARTGPTTQPSPPLRYPTPDGYRFFLELGALSNVNRLYFHGENPVWNDYMAHPDYDGYWKAQNILPHLHGVKAAVMTVGGWFDSEDLHGPMKTYRTIEKNSPGTTNVLVAGPWFHGGWARSDGDQLGVVPFGSKTSLHYRAEIELRFFRKHLKDSADPDLPEASVFETGSNTWRAFDHWPPTHVKPKSLYFRADGGLSFEPPTEDGPDAADTYMSDPRRPVPFTSEVRNTMGHEFMIEDQRFAWMRPDVLSYETPPLENDVTIVGPLVANLHVTTTGTDCDWVVKLIDVLPGDAPDTRPDAGAPRFGHFQMLVRGEVFRSRYRTGYDKPTAMVPGATTPISFELQDVCHAFKKGHRIMVQVQSSWFPLVDCNPQTFVNVYDAKPSDFRAATQRVIRSSRMPSSLEVTVLE